MAQYGTLITNIGLAQIANAQVTQSKVGLEYIAIGDGNGAHYVPSQNQTALVNEVWRGAISELFIDPNNNNRIIVDAVIPVTAGGFTIREIGIFDDQNQLIAVGQYPEKYKPQLSEGVSEETVIHFVIETNNADVVKLTIDPTIIIASRSYVDGKIAAHTDPSKAGAHKITNIEGLEQELTSLREGISSGGTSLTNHISDTNKHLQAGERSNFHPKNTVPIVDGRTFLINGEAKNLALFTPAQWRDFLHVRIGMGSFDCFVVAADLGATTASLYGKLNVFRPYTDESGGGIIQHFEAFDVTLKRYQINDNTWSPWLRVFTSGGGTITGLLTVQEDVVVEGGIRSLLFRTPNKAYNATLRFNASNDLDVGFDIIRNGVVAMSVLPNSQIIVRDHNGDFFYLSDLKQSVSNGKAQVANAITDMGMPTSSTAEFATMAANIRQIKSGVAGSTSFYSNGSQVIFTVSGLGFRPSKVMFSGYGNIYIWGLYQQNNVGWVCGVDNQRHGGVYGVTNDGFEIKIAYPSGGGTVEWYAIK
ncbi:phage tail protein [Metasolibacillus meyeri]|uniref:phage tail protein n=1 Tax=Metasolibacillus meyeri TaxID=1071052 RepID=UPI001EE77F62|nr:phage tail protein [Metasolibacillus meyeri]